MIRHLQTLESCDFDTYLDDIGEPYSAFKRKSGWHNVIIPDNKENRLLVERLQQVQHISNYASENQSDKKTKIDPKHSTVLRCRVRAKTDAK